MPTIKKKTSSGWSTVTDPLKTNIIDNTVITFPDPILPGDWPLVSCMGQFKVKSTSLASCGCSLTIPASGTYRIKWQGHSDGDDSGTSHQCALYKNGTQVGSYTYTVRTDWNPTDFAVDLACNKGDTIEIRGTATRDGLYYYGHLCNLQACINWSPIEPFYYDFTLDHNTKPFFTSCSGYCVTDYLEVPSGCTNITIECGGTHSGYDCLLEFDSGKFYKSYWGAASNPRTFSFDYPNEIKYIRACFLTSAKDNCYIYDNTHGQYIYKGSSVN